MRVALVHDWLTGFRGGERVLDELARIHPEADLYTLFHVPGSTSPRIDRLNIRASPLSKIWGSRRHYRALLPLFPWAIQRFHLEQYDLIVSVSHAVAKAIPHDPGIPHLCYCLTPMRYIWTQSHHYLGTGVRSQLSLPLVSALRSFDRKTSGPKNVDRFVATSRAVSQRIRDHYGRASTVLAPPVDVARIVPNDRDPEDFYLLVGGFVPYKREDLAIEAFRQLGLPLYVVGDGPQRSRLESRAPANVSFLGRISDAQLADLYARCRALIYPQEEDFGIVAVEAQSAGRPVIAFGRGGVRDTVIPLEASTGGRPPTGVWFDEQVPEALADAVRHFERNLSHFDSQAIRAWAEAFGHDRFRREYAGEVAMTLGSRDAGGGVLDD